ncbi:MAG: UDP-glucose 4-epimerase GalE [Eubacterium sp.]|nr:UDP-glucose 4-epimerase GalE [Eubacterium sp.]
MSILVCGGAGYIGSHVVQALLDKNYEVVVLDNLSTGHRESVPDKAVLEVADIRDYAALERVFLRHQIDCVMHFCANSLVGESMEKPIEYYDNNVGGTLCLLRAMINNDVKRFIFSSTAATYGEPEEVPIVEDTVKCPTNTYGETKLAVEKMLHWMAVAYGLKYKIFRYFNASGAHPDGEIGEDHSPETHLIPLILKTAQGIRDRIYVFGDDYPTADGSCIRDYIHVLDIAQAHILGMEDLAAGGESDVYNLGNGNGFSVLEVIDKVKAVTGRDFAVEIADRRPGDPAVLIASAQKAKEKLGWEPVHSSLENIIATAWNWHQKHPQGY